MLLAPNGTLQGTLLNILGHTEQPRTTKNYLTPTLVHYWWECKLVQPLWKTIWSFLNKLKIDAAGFPGGAVVKNLPANAGDTSLSPGLGRSHMPRSN